MDDIYTKLINNTNSGSHSLSTTTSPAGTFHTLTQIYGAVPTIDPTKVLTGTTLLGVAGGIPLGGNVSGANSSTTFNIPDGYYSSKTATANDTNLTAANIATGVSIFGVPGLAIISLGNATTSDVLSGKTFSNGTVANVSGSMPNNGAMTFTPSTTTQAIPAGYHNGSGVVSGSANLTAGNIKKDVNLFNVVGTLIGALGNAGAGDVLSGKTFSTSTASNVSGTIPVNSGTDISSVTSATSTNKLLLTVPTGYYDGTATLSTTSANFTASNIRSNTNIFGIIGNMLAGYTYGDSDPSKVLTTASGAGTYVGINYSLWNLQTKDDWVNSGGTVGEYTAEEGAWPAAVGTFVGYNQINYAGSGGDLDLMSNTVLQDARTGLWWSDVSAVGASASSTTNVFALAIDGSHTTGDGNRPTGGAAVGFCDALNAYDNNNGFGGHHDWYLPTQKQLMQAYIDGAANHLPNPGNYFWSSTELYNSTTFAWNVALNYGYTSYYAKTTSYSVRCVRS